MSEVSLEEFLKPISRAVGHEGVPKAVSELDISDEPHFGEGAGQDGTALLETFLAEAANRGIHATCCSADDAASAVCALARELGAGSVVCADDAAADELGVSAALAQAGLAVTRWDASRPEESTAAAADAAVGISFPEVAIADSATVAQACDERCGRAVALLPEAYIAVIRQSALVPYMVQAMSRLEELYPDGLPSHVAFVTGPSSTADIELVNVVGVHGPLATGVVVVEG